MTERVAALEVKLDLLRALARRCCLRPKAPDTNLVRAWPALADTHAALSAREASHRSTALSGYRRSRPTRIDRSSPDAAARRTVSGCTARSSASSAVCNGARSVRLLRASLRARYRLLTLPRLELSLCCEHLLFGVQRFVLLGVKHLVERLYWILVLEQHIENLRLLSGDATHEEEDEQAERRHQGEDEQPLDDDDREDDARHDECRQQQEK